MLPDVSCKPVCSTVVLVLATGSADPPLCGVQAVKWLWEIVGEFDINERRHFLKFFTGSDRAPIGGLGNLRCIIQRDGMDSNKLPTSHTCFNTLLLPSYRSRAHMAARLRLAIMNSEVGCWSTLHCVAHLLQHPAAAVPPLARPHGRSLAPRHHKL